MDNLNPQQYTVSLLGDSPNENDYVQHHDHVRITVGPDGIKNMVNGVEVPADTLMDMGTETVDPPPENESSGTSDQVEPEALQGINEDEEEEEENEPRQPRKRKANRRSASERIQQQNAEVNDLRHMLRTSNSDLDLLRKQNEKQASDLRQERMDHLKTREVLLEDALSMAKAQGDTEKESEFTSLLLQNKVDMQKVEDAYNNSMQLESDRYRELFNQYDQATPIYDNPPVHNPIEADWLERNSWYSKNERLTKMANEVMEYAMDYYSYNGRSDLIGGEDFFNYVDNQMSQYFRGPQQQQQTQQNVSATQRQPQRSSGPSRAPVGGVNRGGAQHDGPSKTLTLTPEVRRELAYWKPYLKDQFGGRMPSDEEVAAKFAVHMKK